MDGFVDKCQNLTKRVTEWGKINIRQFPWRMTQNPYNVLIAEVMLHRTKAKQVASIYTTFLQKFPNIHLLAVTNSEVLVDFLHPLGLHWRIKLMHQLAVDVVKNFNGIIPEEKEKLLSLPGVGEYIASAIRCFSYGYPEILLDTNTVRIIGRYFGIAVKESSRRDLKLRKIYSKLIDRSKPREFNFAMLDLGALVCKAKRPLCEICPIENECIYKNYRNN